jgi:hypothetical protein
VSEQWHTDETPRFVVQKKAFCERCGHDGWGLYDGEPRCHGCGRLVLPTRPEEA